MITRGKIVSCVLERRQWSMELNLWGDFSRQMKQILIAKGIQGVEEEHVVYQYFALKKRMVEARPRQVLRSDVFYCPKEYEQALEDFLQKVIQGKSLLPFLSDKILQADQGDLLLYDWNIYHFHLTKRFREDGFARRSDFELFAYVTAEYFYLIQVYPHQKKCLFSNQEMVRILWRNWPELLKPYHLKGITAMTEQLDDAAYETCRKAGISTAVQIEENQVFAMMGGGYMSNGYSGSAQWNQQFYRRLIWQCEKMLQREARYILAYMDTVR